VNRPTARGLPPRIALPILAVVALCILAIIAYFLKIGLGVTGAALGPQAKATVMPAAAMPTNAPGEVSVPQTGGAPVGGGGPAPAQAGGPPAPILRMLTELRGRIARNPGDLSALVSLAQLYFDAGKFSQALPYYRRALAIDPANPDTRTDYATALHATGDDLGALAQLKIVLDERPDFPAALFNRGIVDAAIGRRTDAIDSFKKFLAAAPHDSKDDEARTALKNLGA
jgi:tetratricopeptide (TPR) repeat protein